MSSPAARSAAFAMGFLSHYGMLAIIGLPYWSQSNWQVSDPVYGRIPTFNGIWWKCMSLKTGGFTCNHYGKPAIYLESDIQACRALMCIACIFSFFAVIIALLGLDCTTMVEPGSKAKARVSLVAGILFIIAGVACGGAVSWFAWKVTMEFYNPLYQNREFVYEYGACLYAGWVSMAVAIIAGLLLTCGACGNLRSEPEDAYPSYSYKPQTTSSKGNDIGKAKTEYV